MRFLADSESSDGERHRETQEFRCHGKVTHGFSYGRSVGTWPGLKACGANTRENPRGRFADSPSVGSLT